MHDLIQSAHKTQEYFLWALSKEILVEMGVTAFAPSITEPNLNFAMQTGELEGDIKKIIHEVEKFYEAQGLPWTWMMNPSQDQTDLKAALEKRGYGRTSNYPVLGFSLEQILPLDFLKKFDIQEVTKEQLSDWIFPLQEAFHGSKGSSLPYLETHVRALHKKADFRHFVAYVEEEPVSAATLSLSSFGARLDDIGTRTNYQRQGFATAITLHAMKVAKDLGHGWIYLEASDEGLPLYTKMGFKELYRNEIYGKKG